jgi:hypothetical protein
VKITNLRANQDAFHRKVPLLGVTSVDVAPYPRMPARTTIQDQPS